jgi:Smg protein
VKSLSTAPWRPPDTPIPLSEMKIIALMVLWSQEAEIDNLVLDALLDDEGNQRLH